MYLVVGVFELLLVVLASRRVLGDWVFWEYWVFLGSSGLLWVVVWVFWGFGLGPVGLAWVWPVRWAVYRESLVADRPWVLWMQ